MSLLDEIRNQGNNNNSQENNRKPRQQQPGQGTSLLQEINGTRQQTQPSFNDRLMAAREWEQKKRENEQTWLAAYEAATRPPVFEAGTRLDDIFQPVVPAGTPVYLPGTNVEDVLGSNAARGTSKFLGDIYDNAQNRVSGLKNSEYADILGREDYAQNSVAGASKRRFFGGDNLYDYINNIGNYRAEADLAQVRGMGEDYSKYAFMTDDEIGVYNYLYATQGKKAARKFLKDLDAGLNEQMYSGVSQNLVNQGLEHPGFASAVTVLGQPARMATSAAATAQDIWRSFTDQEIDPNSPLRNASRLTSDVRQAIGEDSTWAADMIRYSPDMIQAQTNYDLYGGQQETNPFESVTNMDADTARRVGSFAYQTVMSALDSTVNMAMAGGLAGEYADIAGLNLNTEAGVNALQKATNVIGSLTMSSEVMSLGVAESKEKGYSDFGALGVGLIRGAIEYGSEALGGEWVIKNIKENPLNFFKTMILNMIPEGVEEVMSDAANGVVNLIMDAVFGTSESEIPRMLENYQKNGTAWEKENPWLALIRDIAGEEALSFLGGAMATFGTSAVQSNNLNRSINATAERLGTTREGVVQLMQDYQTENPGELYEMAERLNVENEEQFRQKAGEGRRAGQVLEETRTADEANKEKFQVIADTFRKTGVELKNAEIRQLADDMDLGEADQETFLLAAKDAYKMGASGNFSLGEAIRASDAAASLTDTQFRHAFELGQKRAGVKAQEATGSVQERLDASLAMLGENASQAAQAYQEGQDIDTYAEAMYKASALYAANGQDVHAIAEQARSGERADIVGRLTDAQLDTAIQIGQRMAAEGAQKVQQATERYAALREQAAKLAAEGKTPTGRKGSFTLATEGGRVEGKRYTAVDESKLSKRQKDTVAAVQAVTELLGLDVTVVKGEGNWGGAYFNGGRIVLNINSGMNLRNFSKSIAAGSFAHEMTHWLQEYARDEYDALKKITTGHLSAEQLDKLVQEQLKSQPNLSPDEALDEVIANACQPLLKDSKAFEQLARQNMTLAERILDFLKEFTQKIRDAFGDIDFKDDLPIYHAVQAVEGHLDEMQATFDKAVLAARENMAAERAANENTAQEGGVQMQQWDNPAFPEHEVVTAVYEALDHGDAGFDNLVLVGRMPQFIRDLSGIDGDLYLYRNHTYQNIRTEKEAKEENRYVKGEHYHGVGEEDFISAIMSLNNPAITVNDTNIKKNPEIVMVLPVVGKSGTPLTASIGFYEDRTINGKRGTRPHITLSVYEKLEGVLDPKGNEYTGLAQFVDDAVKNGKVISYNKEISDGLPVIAQRSQLGNITASSLNKNVAQFQKEVKDFRAKNKIYYQLIDVDPVQPSSNSWQRTSTTAEAMEAYPNLWNVAAEESDTRNPTQIASTHGTYRNIYKLLKRDGFTGRILDASSGLGLGTQVGRKEFGFDVDDIEPYPGENYKPKYTDYSKLNKKYDAIISSAVLNVLPQDQRDALVVKMGDLLNPGGKMYITTRGKDVETLANSGKNIHLGPMEWIETVRGSYQKGFTNEELKAYLQDALGDGYTVEIARGKDKFNNNTSIIVTKAGAKAEAADPRIDKSTGAKLQEIGSTATDGVVVSDDMAALMQEEGFSKPVDPVEQLSAKYQVWTTDDWERNYLTAGGDLTVAAQIRDFTNAMIADDAIMGYVPAGHYQKSRFGPLRKNIEYRWTFDMDASCPRTFQFVNYRNALQSIAGRPLTDGEAMNLLYLMRRMNQQIPCTYCYVENKRVMKSKSYLDWFQSRADVMSAATDEEALKKMYSYDPKKGTVGTAAQKVFDEWRADVKAGKAYYPTAQEVWTGWNTAKNTVFNFLDKGLENGVIRFGEGVKKATTQKKMVDAVCKRFGITDKAARREIEGFVAKWRYDVLAGTKHVYDVVNDTSVDTINQDILRLNRLASNYASSVSQARLVDDYIPYTDQLKNVSKADKEYIMGMGGIRKHSSNDFRMDYVQDYFLFYADLAAGGWTGHTYTKSVDYCKVFGRTGDRINLSIAMNTENGKIVENQQEGAAWEDARQLRKAYKDVGVMAMVTDNAQLSFALNNDWIDMCIPFHASGLPKAVWYNLRAWSDYTSVQLESYFNSTEMKERLTAAKVNVKGLNSEEIEALYNSTFNVPVIRNQNGQRVKPHFFPNDTTIYGPGGVAQVIPGHHNDAKRYFELCEQYGVHPRFYGTQVTDANGKVIDVTEHPNYVKLIKETSRTDTEQEPIKFNFNEKDENLGMSPFEYAMQRMQEEASIGGYKNTAADPMGIVDMFKDLYLGKNRDIGWMPADTDESPAAERLRTAMEITQSAYNEMYDADVQTLDTTGYQKVLTEQTKPKALMQVIDVATDDTAREKRGRESAYARLQSENAILRQTVKELKRLSGKQQTTLANIQKQLQLTTTPETRLSDAAKLARSLLHEYSSTADTNTVAAAIKAVGDYLLNTSTDQITEEELKSRARAAAMEILDNASETMTFDDVSLQVNPYDAYMGEASEDLANRIVMDAMEGVLRPTAPTKADKQQARTQALKDRIQELKTEQKLSQREAASLYQTIYDLSLQLDRQQSRYETLRQGAERRVAQVRAEGSARAAEIKAKERARADDLLAEQKKHYLDIAKRARERRETAISVRTYRQRIMKLYKEFVREIQHPTETKHIPPQLMTQATGILAALNMDNSREGSKAGQILKEKLAALKVAYDAIQRDKDFRSAAVYDPIISEMMQTMIEQVGDTPINQMSEQQLEIVYNVLKAMKTTASKAMKIQLGNEERDAYQTSVQMTNETRSSPNKAGTGLFARWFNSQLSPERMFHRLGGYHKNSTWSKVYQMLNGGQLKSTQVFVEGSRIFEKLLKGKDYDAFVNPKNTVDIGLKDENGNTIYLTHGMMVSLYMHLLNEENTRHAILGGVEIPALKDYYNGKKTRGTERAVRVGGIALDAVKQIDELKEQMTNAETPEEQRDIQDQINELTDEALSYAGTLKTEIEKKLTDYDRQWISSLKTLFDQFTKDQINATTMEVYGIKKAAVENYYPIWVDGDFLNTPFESIARDFSIENVGFLKERVTSSKPIRLADASEVAASQLKKVSQYVGLMPVVRDFNKIWGKSQRSYSDSLKKAVHSVFGQTGVQYIDNLMADLNGARSQDDGFGGEFFNRIRGHMAQAALTLSMRTAFGQTASYPTAAATIGWSPLIKALFRGGKNNWMFSRADQDLIAKYSPLLAYRMKGYSSVELGDIASSNSREARIWRKARWLTGWIQFMDGATVGRLWYAAEYYVQDHNKDLEKGTDAYYQEVAKVYNDIIEKTQPNYTTMQRPDILRNPNALVRSMTMFLTQRLQNVNILIDAAATLSQAKKDYAAKRFDVTKEDVHQAAVDSRRAVVSQIVASATIVGFKFLADVIQHSMNAYRDDDDELTGESVGLQLLDMFLDSVTGNLLWGSELYDLVESRVFGKNYYGIEVSSVSTVTDMIDSFDKLLSEMLENGVSGEKFGKRLNAFAKDLSSMLGIPLGNAEKIVMGAVYHAQDIANGNFGSFEAGVNWLNGSKLGAWEENLKDLGITQRQYAAAIKAADADSNGSLKQDELGTWLVKQLEAGSITEAQANAFWKAAGKTWTKTFDEWRGKSSGKAAQAAPTAAAPKPTLAPVQPLSTPAPQSSGAGSYEDFDTTAPIYGSDKRQAAYAVWESQLKPGGMSLDRFTQILSAADADRNGSLKQDELGYALQSAVSAREMTEAQAAAVWGSQGWKHDFATWNKKHAPKKSMPGINERLPMPHARQEAVEDESVTAYKTEKVDGRIRSFLGDLIQDPMTPIPQLSPISAGDYVPLAGASDTGIEDYYNSNDGLSFEEKQEALSEEAEYLLWIIDEELITPEQAYDLLIEWLIDNTK